MWGVSKSSTVQIANGGNRLMKCSFREWLVNSRKWKMSSRCLSDRLHRRPPWCLQCPTQESFQILWFVFCQLGFLFVWALCLYACVGGTRFSSIQGQNDTALVSNKTSTTKRTVGTMHNHIRLCVYCQIFQWKQWAVLQENESKHWTLPTRVGPRLNTNQPKNKPQI